MNYKYLFSDMDGTLIHSSKKSLPKIYPPFMHSRLREDILLLQPDVLQKLPCHF